LKYLWSSSISEKIYMLSFRIKSFMGRMNKNMSITILMIQKGVLKRKRSRRKWWMRMENIDEDQIRPLILMRNSPKSMGLILMMKPQNPKF